MKFNNSQFEKLAAAKKNYEDVVQSVGKDAVLTVVRQFLDAHPEVTGVQWDQYTPYFNDGEACHFYVREVKLRFKQDIDELDADAEFEYSWDCGDKKKDNKSLSDDVRQLDNLLQDAQDSLEVAFGDHVTITVSKDGIEIDECEHD